MNSRKRETKRHLVLSPRRISNSITNRIPQEAGEEAEVAEGVMIKTIKAEEGATRATTSSIKALALTQIESQ